MKPKIIAFVTDSIYSYNKGGKEKRISELTTRLSQRGYDVHIYCMKWWKTDEKIRIENGVTLHAISPYYPLYSGKRRSIKQGVLFGLHCLKLIHEKFDLLEVDHIPFFPLYSARIVCTLKKRKLIASWHEVWGTKYWIRYMGLIGVISAVLEYMSFYLPDILLVSSELTKSRLIKYVSEDKIFFIPNGINSLEIIKVKPLNRKFDVIYAGRLLQHKNVDILLRALKLVKHNNKFIKAIIVGNGPEKETLIALVDSMNLNKNITFLDFLPNSTDIYSYIKSSRMFILPSEREGFGLVAIEALACGIPVITVNSEDNAAKFLINNENGIVTSLNASEIAQAITKLLKTTLKINKTSIFDKYNWVSIVDDLEKVYNA